MLANMSNIQIDSKQPSLNCFIQFYISETILNCDGIIIGTTENIGYMSGLTKDMFDRCYNFWLNRTDGIPVCIYIRAGLDGTGTKNSIESIVKSLN